MQYRSWESSSDIECPSGGHARQQADDAFGSEDGPGRYTYGGGGGPGTVSFFGSGRISGQLTYGRQYGLEPIGARRTPEEEQTSRPMEGVTSPAPLGHSVMKLHLDSQPSRNKLKPDQSGCLVTDDTPCRKVGFYDNQTVSDLLVDSNMYGGGDPVPRRAPSELAEHSTSVEHSLRLLQPEPSEHPAGTPRGVVGFSDNQPVSEPTDSST